MEYLNIKKNFHERWIKNFYYNRSSILKLIFLYTFLKKENFVLVLSKRIQTSDFLLLFSVKNELIKIHEEFLISVRISELSFGFFWVFESHFVYYFKDNFDFDEFYNHFSNIENSENIYWSYFEFFDKNIKILEVFKKKKKDSFVRVYRDESINVKSMKLKNLKKTNFNLNQKESFLFLKNYDSKKIRLVFYFFKL